MSHLFGVATQFTTGTPERDSELKLKLAQELAKRPADAFAVALAIFRNDSGKAAQAVRFWVNGDDDEFSEYYRDALKETDLDDTVATKPEILLKVMANINSSSGRLQLEGLKLYAEICGWTGKNGGVVTGNTSNTYIAVIPQTSSDPLNWEKQAAASQAKLITEASVLNAELAERKEVIPS